MLNHERCFLFLLRLLLCFLYSVCKTTFIGFFFFFCSVHLCAAFLLSHLFDFGKEKNKKKTKDFYFYFYSVEGSDDTEKNFGVNLFG